MGLVLAALVAWTVGCNQEQREAAPAAQQETTMTHEHGDNMAMDKTEQDDDAKIQASFASLSAEDRALAEKQQTCPVSDERLGLMDTPIKVTVNGHDVFICCPGCKEALEENPDEYLAKLGIQPAAQ